MARAAGCCCGFASSLTTSATTPAAAGFRAQPDAQGRGEPPRPGGAHPGGRGPVAAGGGGQSRRRHPGVLRWARRSGLRFRADRLRGGLARRRRHRRRGGAGGGVGACRRFAARLRGAGRLASTTRRCWRRRGLDRISPRGTSTTRAARCASRLGTPSPTACLGRPRSPPSRGPPRRCSASPGSSARSPRAAGRRRRLVGRSLRAADSRPRMCSSPGEEYPAARSSDRAARPLPQARRYASGALGHRGPWPRGWTSTWVPSPPSAGERGRVGQGEGRRRPEPVPLLRLASGARPTTTSGRFTAAGAAAPLTLPLSPQRGRGNRKGRGDVQAQGRGRSVVIADGGRGMDVDLGSLSRPRGRGQGGAG